MQCLKGCSAQTDLGGGCAVIAALTLRFLLDAGEASSPDDLKQIREERPLLDMRSRVVQSTSVEGVYLRGGLEKQRARDEMM